MRQIGDARIASLPSMEGRGVWQAQGVQQVADRISASGGGLSAVLHASYETWRADRCIRLGAGLAYYGLFALVPLLTLAIAFAGLLFTVEEVQAFLAPLLADLFGTDTEDVAAALAAQVTGRLVTQLGLVGIGSLLVAASLVFVALQDALNVIWGVPYEPGLEHVIRRRLLSFLVVLVTGGLLVVALAAQAVVGVVRGLLPDRQPLPVSVLEVAGGLVPVAVAAVALALLFRLLPQADVDERAAVVSAAATAALMAIGVEVVGWYLRRFGAWSPQGATGSVFVLLTAIYAQSQIVLAGAELSKVLTHRWRSTTPPPTADERRGLRPGHVGE